MRWRREGEFEVKAGREGGGELEFRQDSDVEQETKENPATCPTCHVPRNHGPGTPRGEERTVPLVFKPTPNSITRGKAQKKKK